MEKYLEKAEVLFTDYAPKVVTALVILIIGLFVIGHACKNVKKSIEESWCRPYTSKNS